MEVKTGRVNLSALKEFPDADLGKLRVKFQQIYHPDLSTNPSLNMSQQANALFDSIKAVKEGNELTAIRNIPPDDILLNMLNDLTLHLTSESGKNQELLDTALRLFRVLGVASKREPKSREPVSTERIKQLEEKFGELFKKTYINFLYEGNYDFAQGSPRTAEDVLKPTLQGIMDMAKRQEIAERLESFIPTVTTPMSFLDNFPPVNPQVVNSIYKQLLEDSITIMEQMVDLEKNAIASRRETK